MVVSKDIGDIGEIEFLLKAKKLGFYVLKPYSSILKYDFVLDNHQKMLKIQVKTTTKKTLDRDRYKIIVSHGRNEKKAYSSEDVDFFIVYIQPENLFYIFPFSFIKTKTLNIYPYQKDHISNNYLERWDLLK